MVVMRLVGSADDNSQHLSLSCLSSSVTARTNQYQALLITVDYLVYQAGLARAGDSGTGAVD